ncbi:ABC transporter ATP-binding protein/permease [Tropheryma whipplei]|uniref:ABC transporter ATP-binding protein/permease n=2 Tax=Tropheryma whipplei TaxID=2039 RepID=UPI001E3EED80|nr:ATP-binding cassette domain-containing protein [Tropheryma whipplei]
MTRLLVRLRVCYGKRPPNSRLDLLGSNYRSCDSLVLSEKLRVMRAGKITIRLLLPPVLMNLLSFGAYIIAGVFNALLFTELLSQRRLFEITILIGGIALTLIARPLISVGEAVLETRAGTRVKQNLRQALLTELDRRGPMRVGFWRSGKIQALISDGIESIDLYFVKYFVHFITTVVSGIVIVIIIWQINWIIAVVLLFCAIGMVGIPRLWDKALGKKGQEHWVAYENMNADFIDAMMGMSTLKSFGAAERYGKKLEEQSNRLLSSTRRRLRISLGENGLRSLMRALGPALGLVIAIFQIRAGHMEIGQLFLVIMLSIELFRPLNTLVILYYGAFFGIAAVSSINEILEERSHSVAHNNHETPSLTGLTGFDRVSYTYIGADKSALTHTTFSIPSNKTTAIVGLSGSGKSTALGLLMGFDRPNSGQIRVFGNDPVSIDTTKVMTLVPQDPVIFPGTIREILASANRKATEAEMIEALRYAQETTLHLETEHDELDILDVCIFEHGKNLSGGQKQRLAIARALIRNTPILVLDESTSALDTMTESALLKAIRTARPDLTLLIVTHRIDTAAKADQVVVMANGSVTCAGAPQLLARDKDSVWSKLVKAQLGDVNVERIE